MSCTRPECKGQAAVHVTLELNRIQKRHGHTVYWKKPIELRVGGPTCRECAKAMRLESILTEKWGEITSMFRRQFQLSPGTNSGYPMRHLTRLKLVPLTLEEVKLRDEYEARPSCPLCRARLGDHHANFCTQKGSVLPSEIPGYIESIVHEVGAK